jgi:D-inositol-3-phosphate glycosyltransferase
MSVRSETSTISKKRLSVAIMTACRDRHYAVGLALALASSGALVEVVGGDEIDGPELHGTGDLLFFNFHEMPQSSAGVREKLVSWLKYYAKLIRYMSRPHPKLVHILWNNKFEHFDRTILMLYYKMLGKKIAFTAHNVNRARRDSGDNFFNRTTLKFQYRLCDHIFTHTQKMKDELCQDFKVSEDTVTVIRYPINNAIPDTKLTPTGAKRLLGLASDEKTILFFGKIRPYKGIEDLLDAFRLLSAHCAEKYRLIIAGEPNKEARDYLRGIREGVQRDFDKGEIILRAEFIPDEEIEPYFKGADVLVLPYKDIFQSGVLFLSYSFGLPVIATDVGSFREDIIVGRTGYLARASDPKELASAIETYFGSDIFKNLATRREELKDYVRTNHSWEAIAALTTKAYASMVGKTV